MAARSLAHPEHEALLEAGLGAAVLMLLIATGAAIYGWIFGAAHRRSRHRERFPAAGLIAPERHRNTIGSPAR